MTPKALLAELFRETARGNGQPFLDALADDASWTVMGTTGWSRAYRGKQTILRELLAPLQCVLRPPLKTLATRMIAEGDLVVVEARGANRTRTGIPYENQYCMICEVRGGQIAAITEYADTEMFTQVLGERPGERESSSKSAR